MGTLYSNGLGHWLASLSIEIITEKACDRNHRLRASFSPNPFMAASRASRAVVKYPDVVPIEAGTPLPPGRPLRACDPWVCLKRTLTFGQWDALEGRL
jgi:hypothetical protein